MMVSRRNWIKQSILASSAMLASGSPGAFGCAPGTNTPSKDSGLLQLNWNENPYGPSQSAVCAINDAVQNANRYPIQYVSAVKQALAKRLKVKPSNLLITAGSTEVLSLLGQHVGLVNGEILTCYPTFPTIVRFGDAYGAGSENIASRSAKSLRTQLVA